jgi:DNA repair photolyase
MGCNPGSRSFIIDEEMVKEITAKTLLSSAKHPDPWFGVKHTMNLYRGCQHQCIYCDSRSECYQIEDFADILVKTNAIELLKKELPSKRTRGTIGLGSMNDCYMPLEERYRLTRKALELVAQYRFPVHIITKSDLVLRDLDLLKEISKIYAAVSFTITTADDALAAKLEPGAPSPSRRYQAIKALSDQGLYTGITLMPVLPFIEDNEENIAAIVEGANRAGAKYIIASFGMTMRDRQRAYYYEKLDLLFPGLREKYEKRYGDQYSCGAPNAGKLEKRFREACAQRGIATRMSHFTGESPQLQIGLFDPNVHAGKS